MSKETFFAFREAVEQSPELSERLRSICQGGRDETAAGFVRLAVERGFVVTLEEVAQHVGLGPGGLRIADCGLRIAENSDSRNLQPPEQ